MYNIVICFQYAEAKVRQLSILILIEAEVFVINRHIWPYIFKIFVFVAVIFEFS